MQGKVDCSSNRWLAEAMMLLSAETMVFAATADCEENYDIDDLWISAWTKGGQWTSMPIENKTIKGQFHLKYDGKWNDYFDVNNPAGITKKLSGSTIPAEGHIYFINKSKYDKLIERNAGLAYLAPDGFILYSTPTLQKAFLGYANYKNKSHTEEFNKYYNPHWETKALIDLEKGTYYSIDGPRDIFEK